MNYVIIFEATPNAGREADYLELAGALNALLPSQPGFIEIDRGKSIMNEGKLISISRWESEEAIEAWLRHPEHRVAQERGKKGIFKFMRITRLQVLTERDVPTG